MGKTLTTWCKAVQIELIRRDMSVDDLAKAIGKSRVYTSGIVHGRIRATPTEQAISDVLNIPYASEPDSQIHYK